MWRTTPDTELIDAAIRGSAEAYGELMRKYQDRLFTSIVNVVGCPAEAEDIVQEAFLHAYANLRAFQRKSSFFTWLYRITLNLALTRRRRMRVEISLEKGRELAGYEPSDHGDPPGERLLRQERVAQVQAALAMLDEDQRAVLVLREVEGCDYHTIGRILGLKVGTVRSRLHRARMKLRAYLEAVAKCER